nr:hypothetical protein [Pseudodesulfovibrio sp.]
MSKGNDKPKVWFKTARQVHQYLTCPLGEEYLWGNGDSTVKEDGTVYTVSEKTVYNHTDDKEGKEKLKRNRAKAFAKRTVDIYAKTHLAKVVADADPTETDEEELTSTQASAARRVEADALVKEYDAKLKRLKLKQEMGQMSPTAIIERELGERTQGFKLDLTAFMRDFAPELLTFVGGDVQVAKEMIDIVDGDEEKAEQLSGFVFSRKPLLLDAYKRRLTDALNAFAMGTWFTDEMREAWERLEASRREEAAGRVAELIKLVGGDEGKLGAVLMKYEIRVREAQ